MMCFTNNIDIVAVSTMDVIANNASRYIADTNQRIKRIGTILDAKRKQFYVAVFDRIADGWKKVLPECLMTAPDFVERFGTNDNPIWLLGEGLLYYAEQFRTEGTNVMEEEYWYPSARSLYYIGRKLAQAGNFADGSALKPLYLRQPDAVEKSQRDKP